MRSEIAPIRRRNRVYKSLHKPLTYWGVERTLFFFICVAGVGTFNLFNSLLAGILVFIGGYAFGSWVTNTDPALLRTYIIPKVMDSGYVELGKKRMEFSRKG